MWTSTLATCRVKRDSGYKLDGPMRSQHKLADRQQAMRIRRESAVPSTLQALPIPADPPLAATPPTITPRLLRIESAARYLSCTTWYLRSKIWDGELPAVKLGKRWLLDRSDLDQHVEREKQRL